MTFDEYETRRTIMLHPYPYRLVVTTSEQEFHEYMTLMNAPPSDDDLRIIRSSEAFVSHLRYNDNGDGVGILMIDPSRYNLYTPGEVLRFQGVLIHELQHVITRLQTIYGFCAKDENEPTSYLMEHLYTRAWNIIQNKLNLQCGLYHPYLVYQLSYLSQLPMHYVGEVSVNSFLTGVRQQYWDYNQHQVVMNNKGTGFSATTFWQEGNHD